MGNTEGSVFVLMRKNPVSGFFEEELGRLKVENGDLVEGLYAEQTAEGLTVCLRAGIGTLWTEISDEMFEMLYDNYDADPLPDFVTEFIEIDGCFNPAWEARFPYSDDPGETENMINQTLAAHRKALPLLPQVNKGEEI